MSKCLIVSSDKATKICRKERKLETDKTKQDYELGPADYQLPRLNRNRSEVYRILQADALDRHWINLYNSTIHKNRYLFVKFYLGTEDDYTKTYNFFVENQLKYVLPVGVLFRKLIYMIVY